MDAHDRQALVYADYLKEEYPDLSLRHRFDLPRLPSLAETVSPAIADYHYACPNCEKRVKLEFQTNDAKHLYYVRLRCKACQFGNAGYFTYMASATVSNVEYMISQFIEELLGSGIDLLEQTECELENEWVTRSEDDDDIPF